MGKMNLLISLELDREEVAPGWEAVLLPNTGQEKVGMPLLPSPSTPPDRNKGKKAWPEEQESSLL